jgi:hypothetical protein
VFPALTTTPPEPAADPAPPPAGAPLEARVGEIERKQDRTDGKIDKVIEMLTGRDHPTTSADAPAAGAADITEQVRQAVRDVNAESAKSEPKAPAPEMTPREVGVRGKDRLQKFLFGGDPKK